MNTLQCVLRYCRNIFRVEPLATRVFPVVAACALLAASAATAQTITVKPGAKVDLPAIRSYAPKTKPGPLAAVQATGRINLSAQLIEGGEAVTRGMKWRVFNPTAGEDGKLPLIASAQGGSASFDLIPGSYLVHAAFGRAGATKRIKVVAHETRSEDLVMDAGGLKLGAILSGGVSIPPKKLRFNIYDATENANGDRALIVPDVEPGTVVRLNAGTYHVVSTYGSVNAVIRSDIRVEAGKLTEAVVEHKAAQIMLKLVREQGGEAIADTSWVVMNEAGDVIRESVGAFAPMVLAEGAYAVVAKNRDRIYQKDFEVVAGSNRDVEVMATE